MKTIPKLEKLVIRLGREVEEKKTLKSYSMPAEQASRVAEEVKRYRC